MKQISGLMLLTAKGERQVIREMPRTILRYAIERLPEAERRKWMTDSVRSAFLDESQAPNEQY